MNRYVSEILKKRGIADTEEFLSASPKRAYDPFLMKNVREGVKLVSRHIDAGDRICVYGDYDTDGVTASAIILETLREVTDDLMSYIPKRPEGYGMNRDAVDHIRDEGAKLIITVDCGSRDLEEIEYARSLGIDVIVTDHHTVEGETPYEYMINPKFSDSGYPYRELAGCGVAFKFALALIEELGIDDRFKRTLLDLVAIGTVGDMVPLLDENRLLVKYGLKAIRNTHRKCVADLIGRLGKDLSEITEEEISYYLVSHLTAPGRVADPALSLSFLMERDEREARKLTEELIAKNNERKRMQAEAIDLIDPGDIDDHFILTEIDRRFEGVAGIIAGRLKDEHNVPAIVFTGKGDELKGSGRSIDRVDLYTALDSAADCLIQFGGHEKACGLSVRREDLPELKEKLRAYMKKLTGEDMSLLDSTPEHDIAPAVAEVGYDLYDQLKCLAPFGMGNEMPVLLIEGTVTDSRYIGEEGKHIKFRIDNSLDCIRWNVDPETADRIAAGRRVKVYGYLKDNSYRGNRAVQIDVREVSADE